MSHPSLRLVLLVGSVLTLSSCITIPIEENGVFQASETITPGDFDISGLTLETKRIPVADSVVLDVWWMRHDSARATVLYFGGQGFLLVKSRTMFEALAAQQVNVMAFDYRGYGRSEGEPTVEALKHDALVVYDSLLALPGIDPRRLILHGHSMGSFVATSVAMDREAAGLVLENPATDVEGLTSALVPLFLKPFVRFDIAESLQDESNVERVQQLPGIALLVAAGENDQITPPDLARELYEAAATEQKTLIVAPERGHNDVTSSDDFAEAFAALLDELTTDR